MRLTNEAGAHRPGDASAPDGGRVERGSGRGDPKALLGSERFMTELAKSLQCLPPLEARVLSMREAMGMPVEEICARLNISATRCHETLLRARLQLCSRIDEHIRARQDRS